MRTHLQLASTGFPPDPKEAGILPEGRFGRRLAEHIAGKLPDFGFEVEGISPEDWGWQIRLNHAAFPLWVGCGNLEGTEDGFLCFFEPSRPEVRRGFRRIEAHPVIERLAEALEAIVAAAPGVTHHHWWEGEMDAAPTPDPWIALLLRVLIGACWLGLLLIRPSGEGWGRAWNLVAYWIYSAPFTLILGGLYWAHLRRRKARVHGLDKVMLGAAWSYPLIAFLVLKFKA